MHSRITFLVSDPALSQTLLLGDPTIRICYLELGIILILQNCLKLGLEDIFPCVDTFDILPLSYHLVWALSDPHIPESHDI